jgi:hypothetical protein
VALRGRRYRKFIGLAIVALVAFAVGYAVLAPRSDAREGFWRPGSRSVRQRLMDLTNLETRVEELESRVDSCCASDGGDSDGGLDSDGGADGGEDGGELDAG